MENQNLYINVRNQIRDMIYHEVYREGDRLPPERTLAETLDISRVTVRKALQMLEEEKLIMREVGSGTTVQFHNYGAEGSLDMIVLLAPIHNPFFAEFLAHFQKYANDHGSLVLYVEKPRKDTLENCLYRLLCKGMKDVVIWPDDQEIDLSKIKVLRAMGMNMVFFDSNYGLPYTDCVMLDNIHAISCLYGELQGQGCQRIGYVGWDNMSVYSVKTRQEEFLKACTRDPRVDTVPWAFQESAKENLKNCWESGTAELPEAFICGAGELGIASIKALEFLGRNDIRVASIDEFPESVSLGITTYAQNFPANVSSVYQCLENQNKLGPKWQADSYFTQGKMHTR